jgi:exodeoxyribonuclease VII small subunit
MAQKNRKYIQIRSELDEVLEQLQNVDNDVDKAIDLHRKGEHLINELRQYLKDAKNELTKTKN